MCSINLIEEGPQSCWDLKRCTVFAIMKVNKRCPPPPVGLLCRMLSFWGKRFSLLIYIFLTLLDEGDDSLYESSCICFIYLSLQSNVINKDKQNGENPPKCTQISEFSLFIDLCLEFLQGILGKRKMRKRQFRFNVFCSLGY